MNLEQIIDNETDIVKLKCLLKAISEDISLSSYVSRAKEHYKNKKIMTKIESLENEIKKLKEEMK